ncbi:hypothetical protein EYC80_000420 [Monilinia laxa]|uniref:Uncharacterized protein n=1 Tax=Monilinia laxa TaxID=61186 RepID=A0A5N6KBP4_MONLA|nr:hypothetical protein EYC80_000420 [Monilinia laxa]
MHVAPKALDLGNFEPFLISTHGFLSLYKSIRPDSCVSQSRVSSTSPTNQGKKPELPFQYTPGNIVLGRTLESCEAMKYPELQFHSFDQLFNWCMDYIS